MLTDDFESAMKIRYLDVNYPKKEGDKVIFLFLANSWISFNKW